MTLGEKKAMAQMVIAQQVKQLEPSWTGCDRCSADEGFQAVMSPLWARKKANEHDVASRQSGRDLSTP